MTDRTEYTKGLRQLADILDSHPDLPLPWSGTTNSSLAIFTQTREQVATFARLIPGKLTKKVNNDDAYYGFELRGAICGLNVLIYAPRAEVCERVVLGTREVTVPATPRRPAVKALPATTTTIEDVQWLCGSLLAPEPVTS